MIVFALAVLLVVIITMFIIRRVLLNDKLSEIKVLLLKKRAQQPKEEKVQSLVDTVSTDGLVELWESNKKRFRSFIEST